LTLAPQTRPPRALALLRTPQGLLALISCAFVFRLLLALAVVPPWQGPDEPPRVARAILTLRNGWLGASVEPPGAAALEAEILRSMARYDWWRHYDGQSTPSPVPTRFAQVSQHVTGVTGESLSAYSRLAASCLSLTNARGLMEQYAVLRWFSVLLAIPTLWCAWAGTRLFMGTEAAVGATMLLALHPQFALVSITAGPGALVNLCGAAAWWQAARVSTGRTPIASALALVAIVVAALFVKRAAVPIAIAAALVILVTAAPWLRRRVGSRGLVAAALLASVAMAAFAWRLASDSVEDLPALLTTAVPPNVRESWQAFLDAPSTVQGESFVVRFMSGLFDSAWLYAGWLRHPAPAAWLIAVHLLSAVAMLGLLVAFVRAAPMRRPIAVAAAFAAIQLAVVIGTFYPKGFGAQGQYLFLAIAPFMALLWIGFLAWWPERARPIAGALLIGSMALLDSLGWTLVILPAYV
jgi:hypothetical protein